MDHWEESAGVYSVPSQPSRPFTPHYAHDLGFLDPARSSELYTPEDLLSHPAVLIKAQPWMGKTCFATECALARLGSQCPGSFRPLFPADLLRICRFPRIATTMVGGVGIKSIGTPACWIIDGLDECEQGQPGIWRRIIRAINELPDQNHRPALRILCSAVTGIGKELEKQLRELYPGR